MRLQVTVWSVLFTARALASPALAAPPSGRTPDELFAKAVTLHQAGDTLGAIQYYEAVLEQQPDRVDARSNLGAAYVKLGRYEDAIKHYQRALLAGSQVVGLRFNLGLAYYKADQIPEAAEQFAAVHKLAPKNASATLLLADCHMRAGEYAQVIALLSPLEDELGKDRLFSYLLGTAYIEQGDIDRGQKVIDRLFRDGESAEARLLMGAQYLRSGMGMKAAPEIARAVELNPDLPGVHSLYANALRQNHDLEGAAIEYKKELEKNPNDYEANLWLGLLKRDEDRLDEAMEYLKRAGRMRPKDPAVAYALGRVHQAAGRLEEARKAFEQLVAASPDFQQGHVLLATVYYRLNLKEKGDAERAIVERLRAEAKAKGGTEPEIGPTSFGDGPTTPKEP